MSGDITVAHVSNYTPMDNTTVGPTGSDTFLLSHNHLIW